MSTVSLIFAADESGLIGKSNKLPWHMPADLKFFKQVTMGKAMIMGRKTWDSIGKPLPGRKSIVVTRQSGLHVHDEVPVVNSLAEALKLTAGEPEVFIIGGSELFKASLPFADRIYLTLIHHRFEGDTWIPMPGKEEWDWKELSTHAADEKNPHPYTFWLLNRKR